MVLRDDSCEAGIQYPTKPSFNQDIFRYAEFTTNRSLWKMKQKKKMLSEMKRDIS